MRHKITVLGSIAGLLFLAFMTGRLSAPRSVREVTAKASETKTATAASVETATAAIVQTRTVTRYVDRVVTKPDGTKIETKTSTVGAAQTAETKTAARAAQTRVETVTKIETVDRLVTLRAPAPRFSVGAFASSGVDLKLRGYGPEVGARVIGPLWVSLAADVKARAAIAGARFTF